MNADRRAGAVQLEALADGAGKMVRSSVDAETRMNVEEFLFHQADLLDTKRWSEYVGLFAGNGIYWMPARAEQTTWQGVPSIFAEDINLMNIRVKRIGHPRAWSQQMEWATSHVVANVRVGAPDPASGILTACSNFHMTELRGDYQRYFAGRYAHQLRRRGDAFEIMLQRVDLLSAQIPFDYVIQAWV